MSSKKMLWAPWRVKYIMESDSVKCIFCEKPISGKDKKNFIIYRGSKAFAMLNIYPYNNGHVMVAPFDHIGQMSNLSSDILCEMMDIVKMLVEKIKIQMKAQGFNIGMNIGKISGAGFDEHLHIHIVPRWTGDTNFMPVICDEKVISESLDSVYKKLKF